MPKHSAPLAVLVLALASAACGGETAAPKGGDGAPAGQQPAQEPAQTAAGSEAAAPDAGAGDAGDPSDAPEAETTAAGQEGPHVTFSGSGGRAHWVGTAPPMVTLEIDPAKSEGCAAHGPMDTLDQSVLVDLENGLANVVIEIAVQGLEGASSAEPFAMDQKGCRFEPHVLVVPAGATVEYRNSDGIGHNVHTYARRNDSMNKTVAAAGGESQVYALRDQIEVKCDIHPWMNAWVIVSDASATAISAVDGSFELPPLPPGKHKVSCWHERLGKATGTLSVGEDGAIAELDLLVGNKQR